MSKGINDPLRVGFNCGRGLTPESRAAVLASPFAPTGLETSFDSPMGNHGEGLLAS